MLRDITDSDPGRGGHTTRLVVIAVAIAVIAGTLLAAQPRAKVAAPAPTHTPPPLPRSVGLLAAAFPDGQQAWLLTVGALWRSLDGGKSWALAFKVPADSSVVALQLGIDRAGYVVTLSQPGGLGVDGIWLTADGGRTFEQHPFPNPPGYRFVGLATPPDGSAHAFFSDYNYPPAALVFERQPVGGGHWIQVGQLGRGHGGSPLLPMPPIPILGSGTRFAFLDAAHGVIGTQMDRGGLGVYRTADGGRSWAFQALGTPPNGELLPPAALSLTAVDGRLMLAAAYAAGTAPPAVFLYQSDDGGAIWSTPTSLPTEDGLETPAFAATTVWWVPFGQAVVVTANAGLSWIRGDLNLSGTSTVKAIYPIDDRRAWAFGGGPGGWPPQLLYRTFDGGANWTVVKPPG